MLFDNPRYALTWNDNEVAAWDLLASKQVWHGRGQVWSDPQLASPDTIITAEAGACMARRISDGMQLWRREHCTHVAASPTANVVVLQRGASALDIIDASTGNSQLAPPAPGPLGPIYHLAANGTHAVGFAFDQGLWTWSAAGPKPLPNPNGRTLWRPLLRFLSTGQLAVVDEQSLGAAIAYRYDVAKGVIDSTRKITVGGQLSVGAFAADHLIVEKVLETNYERSTVDLLDREATRKLVNWKPPRHDLSMRNEALSNGVVDAASNRAYVAGDGNYIRAWDMKTGTLLATSIERNGFTADLVLSPDGKHLIVPREDGPVVVLAAPKLTEERKLVGASRQVAAAAISPDGTLVVAAALDGLFVWQLVDGNQVARVDFAQSHEAPTSLAFSPDGKTLWVGTDIGTLLHFTVSYSANRAP
jgi:DNA-binding beta-propeller fold protein YncE